MLTRDLFDQVLIKPYQRGADHLKVLAGYATPALARWHLFRADEISASSTVNNLSELSVDVVYGMAQRDGVSLTHHRAFVEMVTRTHQDRLSCHYVAEAPSVHAKTYIWFREDEPVEAFLGSANYTHRALTSDQVEVMTRCDPLKAAALFDEHLARALECHHNDVDLEIAIHRPADQSVNELESNRLSFLVHTTGETPKRSGINWGQRPSRDPNQAYLSVPQEIARSGFFPPRAVQFTLHPDDGAPSMLCATAQDNDKAIHTTESNAILGKYIRARLGLHNGEYVTRAHFEAYGRTDVTIYKEDDETFHMDFSVSD